MLLKGVSLLGAFEKRFALSKEDGGKGEIMEERKKTHYAWFVMAACCLLCSGLGIFTTTAGQWFPAIFNDIGIAPAAMTIGLSVSSFCQFLVSPFVGKILTKVNVRVLTSVCYIVIAASMASMSLFTDAWMWYVAYAIMGCAGAFVFLIPTPVILGNWFKEKYGLALGIATAFGGVAGAIFNPIAAALIVSVGWRMAYAVVAVVGLVCILPFTAFVLRYSPEEMGLKAYGQEDGDDQIAASAATVAAVPGVTTSRALKSPAFWILAIAVGLATVGITYNLMLASYANEVGAPELMGYIGLCYNLGVVVWTLIMGPVTDRVGNKTTTIVCGVVVVVGIVMMALTHQAAFAFLAGAILFGCIGVFPKVLIPSWIKTAFGMREFGGIYSKAASVQAIFGVFGFTLVGVLLTVTGSYDTTYLIAAFGIAIVVICALVGMALGKRLWASEETAGNEA